MHAGVTGGVHTVVVAEPTFEAFYAREHSAVLGLAYTLSGSRSASEELAQDAFADAYRRWDVIGRYDDPGAWVRRAVANRSVSRWRRRSAELRALTRLGARRAEPLPPLEPADHEFWAAVRSLPARQAQSIALRYLDDLSVAQIADVLDVAESTVRVHLHRGRLALAQKLRLDVAGQAATTSGEGT